MKRIEIFLNSITMYRLVLYGLIFLAAYAVVLAFFGKTGFSPVFALMSLAVLVFGCFAFNKVLAKLFKVPANSESYAITALILFLIFQPAADFYTLGLLAAAALVSMAGKYVVTINRQHIFNPAALTALVLGLFGAMGASWWVSGAEFLPVTLILGLLVVRKIKKFPMFLAFALASVVCVYFFSFQGFEFDDALKSIFTSWPIVFLGSIMLTEPLTAPSRLKHQIIYGGMVGVLVGMVFNFKFVYSTPELALVLGNAYAFLVSPKVRTSLTLKSKKALGGGLYEFWFTSSRKFGFLPGQYMEWTMPGKSFDGRGNRRYFSLASSPSEELVSLGVRMPGRPSAFKRRLAGMKEGDKIFVGQLAGDFVLPKDRRVKIAGIAGGIGITPFRSMAKFMSDTGERRDFVLFYAIPNVDEYMYKDVLKVAESQGLKTVPVLSERARDTSSWHGDVGRVTPELIRAHAPDYLERLFYLSGPSSMVDTYKKLLRNMGVKRSKIITDYFSGY